MTYGKVWEDVWMSKVILTGDWHLSSVGVKSRSDNYYATSQQKLRWLIDTASTLGVSTVICPGDVLHNSNNSTEYLGEIMSLFSYAQEKGVSFKADVGNHDDGAGALSSMWHKRQLELLSYHPAFQVVETGAVEVDGHLVGFLNAYDNVSSLPSDIEAIVAHCFPQDIGDGLYLDPMALPAQFPHLRWGLYGHDHAEYPVNNKPGFRLFRPGSLLRVSASQENDRTPKVILLDLNTLEYEWLEVPSAPFSELFQSQVFRADARNLDKEVDSFLDRMDGATGLVFDLQSAVSECLEKCRMQSPEDVALIKADLREWGFVS